MARSLKYDGNNPDTYAALAKNYIEKNNLPADYLSSGMRNFGFHTGLTVNGPFWFQGNRI